MSVNMTLDLEDDAYTALRRISQKLDVSSDEVINRGLWLYKLMDNVISGNGQRMRICDGEIAYERTGYLIVGDPSVW